MAYDRKTGTRADRAKIVSRQRIENAPAEDAPRAYGEGERLRVKHGDVEAVNDPQARGPARSVAGAAVQALGECYVSPAGPNRGKVVQQVRDARTGELMAVPVDRLSREQGSRGSSRPTARGHRFDDGPEAEARRQERWVEVRPGVKRLATS